MSRINKSNWKSYVLMIIFAAFIWGYSLADLIIPGRDYSEMENRYLAQAPAFSFRTLFNNTYTIKIEEYTNDRFALRDTWITLKSLCETALCKIENNGIVYGKDDFMFEKRTGIDEEQLDRNTASLLSFAEKYAGKANTTFMLVPTSDMILTDKLPKGLDNIDQKPIIDEVYAKAEAAGMNTVDLYPILKEYADVPIKKSTPVPGHYTYYRTDHHWTTFGAYLGCQSFMDSLGLGQRFSDEADMKLAMAKIAGNYLEGAEHRDVPDFYGTYYSKAKLYSAKPDTIRWYDVPVKSVTVNDEPVDGLYDMEKFDVRDKYAAFIYGNNAVTVIESDCNINRENGKTSRLLLIKDSFGNSFAPFLCYGFDEITVVDLRYMKELEKHMESNSYDEILVMYSMPSFAQETSIANLKT